MSKNRFVALAASRFIVLAVLSSGFGLLYLYSAGDQQASLVWIKAAGPFAGQQISLADRTGWGQTHSGIEIHATVNEDPQWMWRASAEIPDSMKRFGGSISISLTQPEWAVFDSEHRVHQGADGVNVRLLAERETGLAVITEVRLNPIAHPEQRQWKPVAVHVPAGTKRLFIEALPGPVGSNNWHDRVFLSVQQVQSFPEEIGRYAKAITLTVLLFLLGLAVFYCGQWLIVILPAGFVTKILYCAIALFLLLFGVRAFTTDYGSHITPVAVARIFSMASSDGYYVAMLAGVCLVLSYLFRFRVRSQAFIYSTYIVLGSISLSFTIINAEMIRLLGGPFNYQWLYYSGFLSGQTAVLGYIEASVPLVASIVIANVLFVCLGIFVKRCVENRAPKRPQACLASTAICFIGICVISPMVSEATTDYDSMKLINPVVGFLKSVVSADEHPRFFTMPTHLGSEDFEPAAPMQAKSERKESRFAGIRNVVVFVLESGGAEYSYKNNTKGVEVTPEIQRYRRQAATFTNIYAHVPASLNSLVSIISSVYPMISYASLTQESPKAPLTSISAALKARGYRTGFFSSGDFRFQRGDEFLLYQQVETLIAYKNLRCAHDEFRNSSVDWPFRNSFDDQCLFAPFTKWVSQDYERPFFAVLWPHQMHHPYSVVGPEVNFGAASEQLNRYLNALHQTDLLLGKVLGWLDLQGILDSTLVLVVGDHGEAFGQHGQWIHASHIYEENIRVPLLLINRRMFNGQQYDTIGGLVDLAPTVMDLLGFPVAAGWQGRSLFDRNRSPRTYFFAPYSRFLFGLREGSLKLIIDAASNNVEVYNLKDDPGEKENLSTVYPEFVRTGEQRIAAWVQYQNKMYKDLLSEKGLKAPR